MNSFASSRVVAASVEAGAAAKKAEKAKCQKYIGLADRFYFAPVAFETTGACGPSTRSLLKELAVKITSVTGDKRELEWLLQRCSIAIVRGNAASVLLGAATCRDETLMIDKTDGLPKDYCEQATLSDSGCGRKGRRQTDDVWESGGPHPRIPSQRHQHFASTGPVVFLPVGATGIENLGNTYNRKTQF